MAGEKTEPATSKKRSQERKEGRIPMSKEITTVALVIVMFYTLKLLMPFIFATVEECMKYFWEMAVQRETLESSDMARLGIDIAVVWFKTAFPLLITCMLVSIVITMGQSKMLVSFKSLKPDFKKLNPLSGLKKLFSLKNVVELVKSILKIVLLGYIVVRNFMDRLEKAPRLMDMEPVAVLKFVGEMVMSTVLLVGIIFAFLAAADFVYQRLSYEKQIRMSKQEIKEEYRNTEGDPQIKGKIRQKQREMAMGRMMQDVPSSDVIIRNPTHFAVAIRFDLDKNNAPLVVAKGADLLALRIVRVAEENDVMVMENKPLARGLYDAVDIGREIPEQFYGPVAEVLAFVYKLKKKKLDGRLL